MRETDLLADVREAMAGLQLNTICLGKSQGLLELGCFVSRQSSRTGISTDNHKQKNKRTKERTCSVGRRFAHKAKPVVWHVVDVRWKRKTVFATRDCQTTAHHVAANGVVWFFFSSSQAAVVCQPLCVCVCAPGAPAAAADAFCS